MIVGEGKEEKSITITFFTSQSSILRKVLPFTLNEKKTTSSVAKLFFGIDQVTRHYTINDRLLLRRNLPL